MSRGGNGGVSFVVDMRIIAGKIILSKRQGTTIKTETGRVHGCPSEPQRTTQSFVVQVSSNFVFLDIKDSIGQHVQIFLATQCLTLDLSVYCRSSYRRQHLMLKYVVLKTAPAFTLLAHPTSSQSYFPSHLIPPSKAQVGRTHTHTHKAIAAITATATL